MKDAFFVLFALVLILGLFFISFNFSSADFEKQLEINYFHSKTCPHCLEEGIFLDDLEEKYGDRLIINRYEISENGVPELMRNFLEKHKQERYFGVVPITFVGENFFVGFDNENGIGADINNIVENVLGPVEEIEEKENSEKGTVIAGIDTSKYSLPVLSIVLGILDGFNVCSLGALVLILGLVLRLRSRKKIVLYGGIFVLTTGIIYGLLVFLWHELFVFVSPYINTLNLIIGLVGLIGGIYFIREYIKFQKHGVTCDSEGNVIVSKTTEKIKEKFENSSNKIWGMVSAVFLFAAVITIVEFPCSAAVPLAFSGILAEQAVSAPIIYIGIFILFYLLDELIVFGIASYKMSLWLSSPKFTKWATLVEGIILIALGAYYLIAVI